MAHKSCILFYPVDAIYMNLSLSTKQMEHLNWGNVRM